MREQPCAICCSRSKLASNDDDEALGGCGGSSTWVGGSSTWFRHLYHSTGKYGLGVVWDNFIIDRSAQFHFATAAFGVLSSSCFEAEATTLTLSTGHVEAKLCQDISHAKEVQPSRLFRCSNGSEPGEILDC